MVEEAQMRHGRLFTETPSGALRGGYRKSWALLIGINDYPKSMGKLNYAKNDASDFRDHLLTFHGYDEACIRILLDEAATKDNILEVLEDEFPEEIDSKDSLLIFFAGHGEKRISGKQELGYLAPYGVEKAKWSTYIKTDDFRRVACIYQAHHVLFILDCCYSGFATSRSSAPSSSLLPNILDCRARQVITAGNDRQVVADNGPNEHSVFTYRLMEGLKGEANQFKQPFVTAADLASYLLHEVSRVSEQTPDSGVLEGHESGSQFVFFTENQPLDKNWLSKLEEFKNDDGKRAVEAIGNKEVTPDMPIFDEVYDIAMKYLKYIDSFTQ